VEVLGFRNPLTKKNNIKKERVQYWLSKGAKPSDSIYNLLLEAKIIEGKKVAVHSKKKIKGPAESSAAAKQSGGPATMPDAQALGGEKTATTPVAGTAEPKPVAEPEKPTEPAAAAPVEPKPTEPEKAPEEKKEV